MPSLDPLKRTVQRLRWWYARRRGESPSCTYCSRAADYYVTGAGYVCGFCQTEHDGGPVSAMRNLKPRDYLSDGEGEW